MKRRTPLKRSPMKPAKSQLKRTGKLNRRSKTNSRPHEDVELRREYLLQNDKCELAPILVGARIASFDKIWKAWNEPRPADTPLDPNHIFSMGSRPDVWSNLISLCRPVHDWFHANLVEGRICCLYVKGVVKDELNLEEMDALFGQSVLEWLNRQQPEDYAVRWFRKQAVAGIQSREHDKLEKRHAEWEKRHAEHRAKMDELHRYVEELRERARQAGHSGKCPWEE